MEALKDETTIRLDALTQLADETLDLFRDLEPRLEDAALREEVGRTVVKLGSLLDALAQARQSRDDLPQAGDGERGHLLAILTAVRALSSHNDRPVVERLLEANRELTKVAEDASECSLPADERTLVEQLAASCRSFDATLQDHT